MTSEQFTTLVAAAAVQNLQISSRGAGRLKFLVSRAGGCEDQELEIDQLLIGVL